MDYAALKALLVSEGIADTVDAQTAADQLNTPSVTVGVPLHPSVITRILMNNGDLVPIQMAASDTTSPLYATAVEAVTLLRTARDYGMELHLWPGTKDRESWDKTVQAGLIGAQSDADLRGACETVVSPAEAVGLGVVNIGDVQNARLV